VYAAQAMQSGESTALVKLINWVLFVQSWFMP